MSPSAAAVLTGRNVPTPPSAVVLTASALCSPLRRRAAVGRAERPDKDGSASTRLASVVTDHRRHDNSGDAARSFRWLCHGQRANYGQSRCWRRRARVALNPSTNADVVSVDQQQRDQMPRGREQISFAPSTATDDQSIRRVNSRAPPADRSDWRQAARATPGPRRTGLDVRRCSSADGTGFPGSDAAQPRSLQAGRTCRD